MFTLIETKNPSTYYFLRKLEQLINLHNKLVTVKVNGFPITDNVDTYLQGSKSYTPGAIADSANVTTTVTVTGATVDGQFTPKVKFSAPLQGVTVSAATTAADTVTVTFANATGSSKTLVAGTLVVRIDI